MANEALQLTFFAIEEQGGEDGDLLGLEFERLEVLLAQLDPGRPDGVALEQLAPLADLIELEPSRERRRAQAQLGGPAAAAVAPPIARDRALDRALLDQLRQAHTQRGARLRQERRGKDGR